MVIYHKIGKMDEFQDDINSQGDGRGSFTVILAEVGRVEFICIVSVPSGLSGNSSVVVEAVKPRYQDPSIESRAGPNLESSSGKPTRHISPSIPFAHRSIIFIILIVVVSLVMVTSLAIFALRRIRQKQLRTSTDPSLGNKTNGTTDHEDQQSHIGGSPITSTSTVSSTVDHTGQYNNDLPVFDPEPLMVNNPIYDPMNKLQVNRVGLGNLDTSSVDHPGVQTNDHPSLVSKPLECNPIYAQPNKRGNLDTITPVVLTSSDAVSSSVDHPRIQSNKSQPLQEYSPIYAKPNKQPSKQVDQAAAIGGIVYADLANMDTPGKLCKTPILSVEPTTYARIRTENT